MPEISVADFREHFPAPAFEGMDDRMVEARIAEARRLHDVNDLAVLYLTAHLLAVDTEQRPAPDGGAGVVRSEGAGPMQRTFLNRSDKDAFRVFFETTAYGRRFLALEDRTPRARIGAIVVG